MCAYRRKGSPYWQCRRRRLPGYGDTGQLNSQVRDRRTTERMEHLLEQIAQRALVQPAWYTLLDAVRDKQLPLSELLKANTQHRLEALLRRLDDPLLGDAVEDFIEAQQPGRQVRYGLEKLLRLTEERNRVFAEVSFPAEDDVREIYLIPEEIALLFEACSACGYGELATLIRMALLTSADRGVLLAGKSADGPKHGLRVRDVRIYQEEASTTNNGSSYEPVYSGEVLLRDRKATTRTRTVVFGDLLARELLLLCQDKAPDDTVFNIRYQDLDRPWKEVRRQAGLEHVRFKDLRAQTAIYAQRAGIPQAVTARVMGHRSERRTRDYQRHEAVMTPAQADALERALFGLRAEERVVSVSG